MPRILEGRAYILFICGFLVPSLKLININYILIYVNTYKDLLGLFKDLFAGSGHIGDIPERIMRHTDSPKTRLSLEVNICLRPEGRGV